MFQQYHTVDANPAGARRSCAGGDKIFANATRVVLRDVASRSIWEIGDRCENVIPNAAQHELDLLGRAGDFQDQRDAVPFMCDFRRRPGLPVE